MCLAFVSISIQEAFLHEVEALAGLGLVLLSDVLGSVAKAGLFEEVELGTLVKARVAIVFVGKQ